MMQRTSLPSRPPHSSANINKEKQLTQNMPSIFEITDKSKRKVRLTTERWKHIQAEHPQIKNMEELKTALTDPLKITPSKHDPEQVSYYYHYNKPLKRYLFVAVKYLNGDGFIITAYYMRKIQ